LGINYLSEYSYYETQRRQTKICASNSSLYIDKRRLSIDKDMDFNFFSKKFKCNTCNEKFKTEAELSQHKQAEHGKAKI
jgi:hypothetical protein